MNTRIQATAMAVLSALLAIVGASAAARSAEPIETIAAAAQEPVPLFSAASDIASQYADYCSIELLSAAVPDPRVPRHRRSYDQTLAAITQGMLDSGYVLDRYDLPWQDAKAPNVPAAYGLMLFRSDGWRHPPGPEDSRHNGTELRAVYLLPETVTQGFAPQALDEVLKRVGAQLARLPERKAHCPLPDRPDQQDVLRLAPFRGCAGDQLLLLGPVFSGSLDSLGQRAWGLNGALAGSVAGLCVVSSSTTARSNAELPALLGSGSDAIPGGSPRLSFQQLAVGDDRKMIALASLAERFEIPLKRVAFLSEATVFGASICPIPFTGQYEALTEKHRLLCDAATQIGFPSNIANIRSGAQLERDAQRKQNPLSLPVGEVHLPIADAGDIESELPESHQTRLTAAGVELELTDVLDRLKADRPEMVVVVATDVRDRAFLFDQIRARLPRVLLVDFETDRLLAHPDFAHASRGVLTLASSELACLESNDQFCRDAVGAQDDEGSRHRRRSNWSTDRQAILEKAVSRIDRPDPVDCPGMPKDQPCANRPPLVHVVGYDEVRSMAGSAASHKPPSRSLRFVDWLRPRAGLLTVIYSLIIISLWLFEYFSVHGEWRLWDWLAKPAARLGWLAKVYPFVIALMLLVVGALSSLVAVLGCLTLVALLYYAIPILRRMAIRPSVHLSARERTRRTAWTFILWLALLAVWVLEVLRQRQLAGVSEAGSTAAPLNRGALDALSLDPEIGMAYQLVLVLAATVTLMVFTTILGAVARTNRNAALLAEAARETPVVAADAPADALPNPPVPESFADVARAYSKFLSWRDPLLLVGLAMEAALLLSIIGYEGLTPTIFGPAASKAVLSCIAITTLASLALLCALISLGQRLLTVSAYVRQRVLERLPAADERKDGCLGCWPGGIGTPLSFPPTPVAAWSFSGGIAAQRLRGFGREPRLDDEARREAIVSSLHALLSSDQRSNPKHRLALFVFLTGELFLFRFVGFGAALSTLTSVAILYLFPVTGANAFLMLNLSILAAVGLLSGFFALRFESNDVLSNIVCNVPRNGKVSTALFGYIAFPFLLLALAITMSQTPGVMGWSGGILKLVLGAVGL